MTDDDAWKLAASFLGGGLAGSIVTQVVQHVKAKRAEDRERLRRETLRKYGDEQLKTAKDLQASDPEPGSLLTPGGQTRAKGILLAFEAAAKAYTQAGDDVEALRAAKEASTWEMVFIPQAAAQVPDPKVNALRSHAETEASRVRAALIAWEEDGRFAFNANTHQREARVTARGEATMGPHPQWRSIAMRHCQEDHHRQALWRPSSRRSMS